MSMEEVLTARITADVSDAVEGFRAVQRESDQLQVSVKQVAISFSGAVTSGMALYGSFERIQHAQYEVAMASKDIHRAEVTLLMLRNNLADATKRYGAGSREVAEIMERIDVTEEALAIKEQRLQMAQQEVSKSYLYMATSIVPSLITGMESTMRLYDSLKGVKAAVTISTYAEATAEVTKTGAVSAATAAQWLYNQALTVSHALSGPAGWAILGVAAAVTAGSLAWMAMNRQQQEYNETLRYTISDTAKLSGLEAELAGMSPMERLQREYGIVKGMYGIKMEGAKTSASSSTATNIAIGEVNVSGSGLSSPLGAKGVGRDVADEIARRLVLKVV